MKFVFSEILWKIAIFVDLSATSHNEKKEIFGILFSKNIIFFINFFEDFPRKLFDL